jgi:hypothetical protein
VYAHILEDERSNNQAAVKGKSAKAFRFHPLTVKWALMMRMKIGEHSAPMTQSKIICTHTMVVTARSHLMSLLGAIYSVLS